MKTDTQNETAAQGQNVRETYEHDVCPKCGKASVPAEKVPDQSLRACPKCGHDWFENLDKPTLKGVIAKIDIPDDHAFDNPLHSYFKHAEEGK